MKLTLNEIITFNGFVQNKYGDITNKVELPIKTAYKIAKINEKIQAEVEFFNGKLSALLEEYALRDENNNFKLSDDETGVLLKPESLEESKEKILELNTMEVDVDIDDYLLEPDDFAGTDFFMPDLISIIKFMK